MWRRGTTEPVACAESAARAEEAAAEAATCAEEGVAAHALGGGRARGMPCARRRGGGGRGAVWPGVLVRGSGGRTWGVGGGGLGDFVRV